MYEQISEALGSKDIKWTKRGPYNRRNYEVAELNTTPQVVQDLIKVLTSDFMGLTLTNMTGLALHSSVPRHSNDEDEDEEEEDDDEEEEEDEDEEQDFEDREDDEDEDAEDEEEDPDVARSSGSGKRKRSAERESSSDDDQTTDEESSEPGEGEDENKPCTSSSLLRSENLYKKFKVNQASAGGACSSASVAEETTPKEDQVEQPSTSASVEMADPKVSFEIRRWKQGHYTLVTDDDAELKTKALDLMVFFKCKSWSLDCGGNVSYIARFEDSEVSWYYISSNTLPTQKFNFFFSPFLSC